MEPTLTLFPEVAHRPPTGTDGWWLFPWFLFAAAVAIGMMVRVADLQTRLKSTEQVVIECFMGRDVALASGPHRCTLTPR